MTSTASIGLEDLPGPRWLPWLGNAHQLPTSRLHLLLEEMAGRSGAVYRIDIGADGVFTAEGEDRKRQRRLAVTALNADQTAANGPACC